MSEQETPKYEALPSTKFPHMSSNLGVAAAVGSPEHVRDQRLELLRRLDAGIKSHFAEILRGARIPDIESVSDVGMAVDGSKMAIACESLVSSVESLLNLLREVKREATLKAATTTGN